MAAGTEPGDPIWENVLFCKALTRGLQDAEAAVAARADDQILIADDPEELTDLVLDQMKHVLTVAERFNAWNERYEQAMGAQGQPGNRDAIVASVEQLCQIYIDLRVWQSTVTAAIVPAAARNVITILAHIPDGAIEAVHETADAMNQLTAFALDELKAGRPLPPKVELELNPTMQANGIQAALAQFATSVASKAAERERLQRRMNAIFMHQRRRAQRAINESPDPEIDDPSSDARGREPFEPRAIRNWKDAEEAACDFMKWLGFRDSHLTAQGRDGGADVISTVAIAQVKGRLQKTAGPEVRQLFGVAKAMDKKPLFFSLDDYTDDALRFAAANSIGLFKFDYGGGVVAVNHHARALIRGVASDEAPGQ